MRHRGFSTIGWLSGGFLVLTLGLAVLQVIALGHTLPSPDTLAYFDVADQIKQTGYLQAISEHWSPLYSAYVFLTNHFFKITVKKELLTTTVSFAVLLVLAAFVAWFFLKRLARLFLVGPSYEIAEKRAWMVYGFGLTLFFLFMVYRVNLRLPDVLVFSLTLLSLWAWCEGLADKLSLKWVLLASVFSGIGFLARANVLHWSVAVGLVACLIADKVSLKKRLLIFLLFFVSLSVFCLPEVYCLSMQKGHFTFGESGQTVFSCIYGAEWKQGHGVWPVELCNGDVRIFTESRLVHFPGFYEPGKELEGATVSFHFLKALRGFAGAVQSVLFGYYSLREALVWPLLWALVPALLFGISWPVWKPRQNPIPLFLVSSGVLGLGMHLVSYAIGYYLPPYLFMICTGLVFFAFQKTRGSMAPVFQRLLLIIGAGFALVVVLSTFSYFRSQHQAAVKTAFSQIEKLSLALENVPAPKTGLRKVAVAGKGAWMGLYSIRSSGSQAWADLPEMDLFNDGSRFKKALEVLRQNDIRAVLAPTDVCLGLPDLRWKQVEGTRWCLLDLSG